MIFIFMPFFLRVVHSSSFSTPHLKYSVKRFRDSTDTKDTQEDRRENLRKSGYLEVQVRVDRNKQQEIFCAILKDLRSAGTYRG